MIEPRSKRTRIAAEAMFMRPKAAVAALPAVLVDPHARPTLSLKRPAVVKVPVGPKRKPARANLPDVLATIQWFRATWPAAFSRPIRPLAIGAGTTIIATRPETIPLKIVHNDVRYWCGARQYQQALKAGVRRVNLGGSDASEVAPEYRRDGARRLALLLEKAKPTRVTLQKQCG
jgi:hypothetical protein